MACTTILVGKNASFDGSTMVARNSDSGSGSYTPKKFIVVTPEEQPSLYKSVISKVEIPLPKNPMRYTAVPNAILNEGIWASCGVNEKNISMSATETITSNERVLGADPLVVYKPAVGEEGEVGYVAEQPGGIGEEDIVTLVLPYIHSAREGVERLGQLLKEYGTYEMNAIGFQDVNEIWWLETIGGHHWMAKRVPDDSYVIMPNQLGIDSFDLDDAYGEKINHMCSEDLKDFIETYHLDLSINGELNPRDAFGSHSDADLVYNTPRAWVLQRFLNPTTNTWDGIDADYRPDSFDIPWARVPERKITVEDVKYVLSHHYQGTPYDPYSKDGDLSLKGIYRPIGINRNDYLGLVQIRPDKPEAIRTLQWLAFSSNVFNAFVPFYTNISKTPYYFSNTDDKVSTDNFYWVNRIIAALADPYFGFTIPQIERYEQRVQSYGTAIINQFDKEFISGNVPEDKVRFMCEGANEDIGSMVKEETDEVLKRILHESSNHMKNGFSRSDN